MPGGWEAAALLSLLVCLELGVGVPLCLRVRLGWTGGGCTGGAQVGRTHAWPAGLGLVAGALLVFAWSPSLGFTLGRRVSYCLWGVSGPGQCGWAVVEKVMEVVFRHGLGLHDPGLRGFRCVQTVGRSLDPVERRLEGLPGGALSACGGGGSEESLPAFWGVLRVFFWAVCLGCHEDPLCAVADPPLGVNFEDVDGGTLGGGVEGLP